MRVLVTGGSGFIGSNLVRHLSACGDFEIVSVDRVPFPSAQQLPRVQFVVGEVSQTITRRRGIDTIVHLAAAPGVIASIDDPAATFRENVATTFELLEAARAARVRVINASSSIAGRPTSPYAASKAAAEAFCSAYMQSYGLECASLRFANIYGPGSLHKQSAVVTFMKNIASDAPLTVYGDGTQRRDYYFVGDLVHAIERVLRTRIVGLWRLGSGRLTSLLELIDLIAVVSNRKPKIEFRPPRRGEVHSTRAANSSLGSVTPLEDGLRQTWSWLTCEARAVSAVAPSAPTAGTLPPRRDPDATAAARVE